MADLAHVPRVNSTGIDVARSRPAQLMRAMRVHNFGGIEQIVCERVARPVPTAGQALVRVKAAGVGPWDAWVRAGKSAVTQILPLTLGSDFAGIVEEVSADVIDIHAGDRVFGVTNAQFTGAYADYALANAGMIGAKPAQLTYVEAASVPVVASTAWEMVYTYGQANATKRVLVHGAGGNVGSYAVQLAKRVGARVIATGLPRDIDHILSLGADRVIDVETTRFETAVKDVDVVLDTVGGTVLERSIDVLRPGGILVSSVAMPDRAKAARRGIRPVFFLVAVTTEVLAQVSKLLDAGVLRTNVGEVLPLAEARQAHEMLAGRPHTPGKIVLVVEP